MGGCAGRSELLREFSESGRSGAMQGGHDAASPSILRHFCRFCPWSVRLRSGVRSFLRPGRGTLSPDLLSAGLLAFQLCGPVQLRIVVSATQLLAPGVPTADQLLPESIAECSSLRRVFSPRIVTGSLK